MRIFNLIFVSLICIILVGGCDGDEKTDKPEPQVKVEENPEITKLKASMTGLIHRLAEGDKTVLYENEFRYYTDSVSLSDYMENHYVIDYNYDTLRTIEYDSVKLMDDSANVWARVIYNSKAGGERFKEYNFKMYNFNGKWVKPYMSKPRLAIEYLERLRLYELDAENEETEDEG